MGAHSEEEWLEQIRRALKATETDKALAAAEAAIAEHPDSVALRDTLITALEASGRHGLALKHARLNALGHIAALEGTRPPRQGAPAPSRPGKLILISGYFYSGSSAVLDFIRGLSGVRKWPPSGEMRLVKFPGGLDDLSKRFARHDGLRQQDPLAFYQHLVGAKYTGNEKPGKTKWKTVNRNSIRNIRNPDYADYLRACLHGFRELEQFGQGGGADFDAFEAFLATIVRDCLAAAQHQLGAEILAIDQVVTAWRMPIARYLPPAAFVVVHRDPRDQFLDANTALAKTGRRVFSAEEFATLYRNRRRIADENIPLLEERYGHSFFRTSFEDFVIDHDRVGAEILQALNLEGHARLAANFDPSYSIRNIGKHRGALAEADLRTLETLLPEFLDDRAGAPGTTPTPTSAPISA